MTIYDDFTVIIYPTDQYFDLSWISEYITWARENLSDAYNEQWDNDGVRDFIDNMSGDDVIQWDAWYELKEDAVLAKLRWG